MNYLTQEDLDISNKLVENILDHSDTSKIDVIITEAIKNFDNVYRKRQFLSHLNALFMNVLLNELYWRNKNASTISIITRNKIKNLIEKIK